MKFENLTDYLIPIAVLVLYFLLNARKKKEEPQAQKQEEDPPSHARKELPAQSDPSTRHKQKTSPPKPAERKIESMIEERDYSSAIMEVRAPELSGSEMFKHLSNDSAYGHKKKGGVSHAGKLLKGRSLRKAFLLKEILDRPYD